MQDANTAANVRLLGSCEVASFGGKWAVETCLTARWMGTMFGIYGEKDGGEKEGGEKEVVRRRVVRRGGWSEGRQSTYVSSLVGSARSWRDIPVCLLACSRPLQHRGSLVLVPSLNLHWLVPGQSSGGRY